MQIEETNLACVYSFDLKFEGGKRTKFYRKLFGFKSTTKREDEKGREKVYEHFYPGILTPLPHLKLGKSVIAIPKSAESQLSEFFQKTQWGDIDLYSFDGILPQRDRMRAMKKSMENIKVAQENTLREEIHHLLRMESKNELTSEKKHRIARVVKKCEDLMSHDWTDKSEFSKSLENEIEPLRQQIQ